MTYHFDKTVQFFENSNLNNILNEITNKYDINIEGNIENFNSKNLAFNIGENLADEIINICGLNGVILYNTPTGDLIINYDTIDKNSNLDYNKDGFNRKYIDNDSLKYDKYTVISNDFNNPTIKGEYGNGNKNKIIVTNQQLDKNKCERLAKAYYNIDRQKTFNYLIKTSLEKEYNVNEIYTIKDDKLNLNERLKINRIEYNIYKNATQTLTFCRF